MVRGALQRFLRMSMPMNLLATNLRRRNECCSRRVSGDQPVCPLSALETIGPTALFAWTIGAVSLRAFRKSMSRQTS